MTNMPVKDWKKIQKLISDNPIEIIQSKVSPNDYSKFRKTKDYYNPANDDDTEFFDNPFFSGLSYESYKEAKDEAEFEARFNWIEDKKKFEKKYAEKLKELDAFFNFDPSKKTVECVNAAGDKKIIPLDAVIPKTTIKKDQYLYFKIKKDVEKNVLKSITVTQILENKTVLLTIDPKKANKQRFYLFNLLKCYSDKGKGIYPLQKSIFDPNEDSAISQYIEAIGKAIKDYVPNINIDDYCNKIGLKNQYESIRLHIEIEK